MLEGLQQGIYALGQSFFHGQALHGRLLELGEHLGKVLGLAILFAPGEEVGVELRLVLIILLLFLFLTFTFLLLLYWLAHSRLYLVIIGGVLFALDLVELEHLTHQFLQGLEFLQGLVASPREAQQQDIPGLDDLSGQGLLHQLAQHLLGVLTHCILFAPTLGHLPFFLQLAFQGRVS